MEKNLMPQVAKMLGVEIGEEFEVDKTRYKFDIEKGVLVEDFISKKYRKLERMYTDNIFYTLLVEKNVIKKLPPKPKLIEAERVILENLNKDYNWITRDKDSYLNIHFGKPRKINDQEEWATLTFTAFKSFRPFSHLFKFIKWEDTEPYNIQELLKEYEKGKDSV